MSFIDTPDDYPYRWYPTLAQINRRVAELHLKNKLTPGVRRWIQRLFGLRGGER